MKERTVNAGSNKEEKATFPIPTPEGIREDWSGHIEIARKAREVGRELRKGKPAGVALQLTPND
jgi:hypothetical protein